MVASRVHAKYKKEKTELLVEQRKEKYERTKINASASNEAGTNTEREEYGATKGSEIGIDNRG